MNSIINKIICHFKRTFNFSNKRESRQNLEKMTCKPCNRTFSEYFRLKYHIRSVHFNLKPRLSERDYMDINQTWYEGVANTNAVVKIKKIADNMLIMKRYKGHKPVQILKRDKVLDLTDSYPTYTSKQQIKCTVCKQMMLKRDLKLHYEERHTQNIKHECSKCKATFKRSYFYARHICCKEEVKTEPT